MMMGLELAALQFWNAAKFSRRAPDRDQSSAIRILYHLTKTAPQQIKIRALQTLKEIPDERPS